MNQRNFSPRRIRRSRHAFTLIEVLVALGILAILLVIIVLPLRLAFDTFNKGNAQTLTQSAVQATLTDMENDIRQAVYVFPNARVAGVTTRAPYNDQSPYFRSINSADVGDPTALAPAVSKACASVGATPTTQHWSNPARLDMIQVRRDKEGNVLTPLAPSYTVVSYYARRQQMDKPYDPVDNSIVMYRAEYPAFALKSADEPAPLTVTDVANAFNAQIDLKRDLNATDCANADQVNRSALWLTNNVFGEANLLPLTKPKVDTATYPAAINDDSLYSHKLAIPRGLALEASRAFRATTPLPTDFAPATEAPLVPDTSFTTTDVNGDGKIDRVTISLGLASFEVGAQGQLDPVTFQPKGTVLRNTRTVDLPNVK